MLGLSLSLHKHMNILTETRGLLMSAFIYDKLEFISYITVNGFHLQCTEQPIYLLQGNNRCLFWGSYETRKKYVREIYNFQTSKSKLIYISYTGKWWFKVASKNSGRMLANLCNSNGYSTYWQKQWVVHLIVWVFPASYAVGRKNRNCNLGIYMYKVK